MTKRITQSKWDANRAEVKAKAKAEADAAREALLLAAEEVETDETLDEGHGVPGDDSDETDGYAEWSDDELAEEAQERGLTTEAGNREGLIAALEADDQADAAK